MADKDNKSKLTYHVWDKDNNEYDIPDEVVQQRGMDNFAKDFEGGYITMFDDKKQKVDVPIENVGEYRKQGYIWYDTSGNATPINEVGKKPSPSSPSQGTEQTQYPQEVIDAYNSPDNKPGNFKDLAQLNDEYQRGELKKPSLISQALGMMPKVDAGNIGREQKMGGMITNMLLGDNMQQPQDNNQQVQHSNQENAPATEQPKPTVKDVDAITGAAPVQQVDAIYNKYVGKGDALSETMYDLMASGQAQNQEEAQSMAMGAMNRAANRLAQRTTDEFVSKLGDTVEGVDEAVMNGWHSHAVQDNLKKMASQYGIMNSVALDETGQYITQTHGYDQFINGMVKPAMVESLVKKYGENYRKTAEDLATRLYSNDEVIQNQLMNQDIDEALSSVISKYVNPSVVEEYNKAQEEGSKAFNEGMEGSQNIPASLRLGTAIASQYEANQAKDPQKTLSALQKKFNGLYKNPQFLNDMSNAAFKVLQRYGMNGTLSGNPKQFKPMIDEVLKAQLNQLEVKNMIPKGSAEYIMNTGLGNTIVGKITRKLVQTDYQNWLEDIANQQYQPGFWERVGSGALTFAGDAWSYWLPGAAGGKVTKSMLAKAEGRLASDLMAKGMEAKMAERAAKVLIGKSKGMALKTGAAHGAVTFGGQSAISKPIDEIYRTGQLDENGKVYNPSVGKILANTLGEVAKQSAVGAIMQGGTIANMIGKGRGLATNVLADVGGKVVDSSIMTGQQMLERMAQDPSFKPTGKDAAESFLESMANLTSIGLPGMVGKYARFKDAKEFNRKFDFNDRDIAELKRFGYDDLRDAFEKLGINGYRADGEGVQMMGQLTDKYMNLLNDKSVPEVLKAKMMAVVEGKRPSSFSPVIDSEVYLGDDGKYYLDTYNKDGGVVERKEYSSHEAARKDEKKLGFEKSLNITSEYEKAYHTDALQDRLNTIYEQARDKYAAGEQLNDEDKAAIYLHQNASAIGDIMQKQQKGMELTEQEQQMVNSYRHFYDSAFENSPIMKEYVRTFEDSQGVEHGTLRKALEGDGKSRTAEQQKLVEEYQKQLYNDIVLKREMNDAKEQMNQNLIEGQRELPGAIQEGGASAENAEATAEKPVDASVSSDVPPTEPPTPPVGGETPTNVEGTPSVENGSSPSDATTASNESKSDAYVMGQNAYQNGDAEGLKAIDHNDDVSKARLKRAFGDDEAQMNVVVKAYEDGKDMEQFVAQSANSMTPAQQDAVRKYVEAQNAKKGVYDALQHADDGYGDALKELLWTYQTEDGNIVPATLTTGQQVFLKKANEYGGGFVVVPDEDGNPAIKQVSSAEIKEVGTPIPMDDYINQQVTEQKNARQQQFFAQYDGSGLKPSDTVEVAMEAGEEPMQMTFAGYSEDGKIVLSDGKDNIALTKDEFNTWRQNALDASIGAELDAEDAQRANDDAAKAEADKKQRYNAGIVGLGMGQPDYSSKDTEPKVAAEYLQEQFGNDHGKLMNLISGSRSDIKEQLDNKRKAASEYENWLSLNADLDPEKAQKVENDLALVNEQIADLETRYKNWNAIRKEVMTPEEARTLKNERKAEIEKAGVDDSVGSPSDEREVAVLDNKELKKQYPTMDEASNYIASERKRIYHIQNDEVQPQIDDINEALEQYMNGDIDYSADQLKELNTTKAQLEARQANLSASAKDLKAQDKLLNTLYSAENKEERAKAMEELTPSEQRKVLVADAFKKNDLGVIKEIYKDASVDVMDLTPQTLEEAVSESLSPHSLNPESLQYELGKSNFKFGIGKRYDSNKFNYLIAKKGTGMSVNEFAVRVYNDLPVNLQDMGYSDQDVRNTLLDMFKSYDNVKDMRNVALMNRIAAAEEELSAEEEWYEAQKEREIIERQAEIEEYNSYIQDKTLSLPSESELNAIEGMEYDRMMEAEEREREYKEYVKSILPEIADYDDRSNEEGYGGGGGLGSDSSRRGVDEGNRQGEEVGNGEASSESEIGEGSDSGRKGRQETGSMGPGEGSAVRGSHLPQEASFGERLKNAIAETEPNPSEAQKKAGNYKKGHLSFGGYDFTVETPKGTTRSGKDEQGKPWSVTMHDTYGYILGKIGVDGDHIDMFINDAADLDSYDGNVYVVDQVNPETGEFDEHKVMYGYPSEEAATEAYLANYSKGWKGLGKVTSVPKTTFDKWLESSDRKTKPFADYAMVQKEQRAAYKEEMMQDGAHSEAFDKIVELAKEQKQYWDLMEQGEVEPDDVPEVDVAFDMDELLKTLSDEEFKEVSDVLKGIDEEFEYYTANEYERREGAVERKKKAENAKTYEESIKEALKPVTLVAIALKSAVESGDKKAIKQAQKELTEALILSDLGLDYLSGQLAQAKLVKKKDELYKVKRATIKPLTDAIRAIENAENIENSDFIAQMEYDYENDIHPSEEDKPKMQKFVERLLNFHSDKEDKTDSGYTILSSNIQGDKLYPNEKKWFGTGKYRKGVSWVDKQNNCAYEVNPRFNNRGYLSAVGVHKIVPLMKFDRDVKEVKPSEMTEAQKVAFDAVSAMLKKAGIPVRVISNEEMEKVAEEQDNLAISMLMSDPQLRFNIKTPEQKKAAKAAYDWATEHRPDKYAQYAIVNMDNPNQMPEYFEKKSLAEQWRKYYTNAWRIGNYKAFDLNKPFEEQVKNVKGDVPSEFDPYKVDAQNNKRNELKKQIKETEDAYNSTGQERNNYQIQLMKEYMDEHGLASENDIPDDVWSKLNDKAHEKYQDKLDSLFAKYKDLDRQLKAIVQPGVQYLKGKGVVYGYTDGKEIVLNQEHLNPNTPIHEYQHLWRTAAKEMNPELISHGDELIKQTQLFADLKEDPNYKHLSDDEICDEAFARLTGEDGAAILEQMAKDAIKENPLDTAKELTIINRLKNWLKKFWYWTLDTFTKWKPEDIKKMTLEDIRNLVLRDLAQGVDPRTVLNEKKAKKDDKTLAGVHNITEEKLRKALKLGGLANPSLAVIDTSKSAHDNFGEISFIAPSALVDKRTGKTGGTWITDAYTQRYPSVEREMSEKGRQKFNDWVDSLEYPSEAKAEIKRQAEDALSNNNAPAWELMYLKEKGIDIKEYDSRIDYRWKEIISDHPTAEDILNSMKTDPELNEKVTSLAKHAIIHPTWEKVSLEVRRKMYKETGVKASPINPQVRKQTKEIFERDYAPTLLNKDGSPRKKDVKKVVEDIVKEHNDTKKYDFYRSKVKASNYVNKNGLYDDYIRWQENKLDEFGTKNRIFRGYKNDGSRKYVPETLENVSKAMREDADGQTNGSEYTSFGSFIAKLASRVDSTDEMRANKDKLSSNKDKEEFYEKWESVYYDLAKSLYNDVFYGEQRLHDIVSQADPRKYAKKEYGITLTPSFMKKLDSLKNAVQNELKSAYFETKFNRPVHLNEFVAAVVPNNLGKDVRKGLEKSGLTLYDYDPQVEGDRQRAFDEAVSSKEGIRFMFAGEKGAAEADKAEEKTYRMDNLKVAKVMEEHALKPIAIKYATGWERGADGKWRYEMPDFKADKPITVDVDIDISHVGPYSPYKEPLCKLSDLIDDKNLFAAYPSLKNIDILLVGNTAFEGMYDKLHNNIALRTNAVSIDSKYSQPSNAKEIKAALEKFHNFWDSLTGKDKELADDAIDAYGGYTEEELKEDSYFRELEKGNPKVAELVRLGNSIPSKKDVRFEGTQVALNHEGKLTLAHEIQHAIQDIEGFAEGGNPEQFQDPSELESQYATFDELVKDKFGNNDAGTVIGIINGSTPEYQQFRSEFGKSWDEYFKNLKGMLGMMNGDEKLFKENYDYYVNEGRKKSAFEQYQSLAGEVEARNVMKRMWMTPEERRNSLASETEDVNRDEQIVMNGNDASYSIVKDPETIKKLDKEDTVKVYRAMQVGEDGKLYPPMAAKVKGKFVEPIELGKWEQADERPELADDKGMFTLNKGNGKSLKAAYNPYLHTSRTPLNDQFSEAQNRPNIVTVEVEVPKSELTSGYKADKAKDAVGEVEWKAGIIQGQLTGKRKVVLSRWDKPVRIVPDSEVADVIVNDMFKGKNITMPSNVVTPSLRKELEKRGVPFVETDNRGRIVGGENDGVHYSKVYGKNAQSPILEQKLQKHPDSLMKAGTYFSGGGLVEEGLKGIIDPVVAVEYDRKISGVYRNNFGQHIVTADVRDVDPKELVKHIDGEVEYFHASPVCKNYSQAKSNGGEVELDKETAKSTADFIDAVKPRVVTIENVKGYKDSEAMKIITQALDKNGYKWDADVYNAADFGGYTSRERLIVRAVKDGELPEKPKKQPRKGGWLEAVEDILPTLTEKKNGVAPWMDARLKADGIDWQKVEKPLYVMGSAYADGKIPHAYGDEILPTLRTKSGDVIIMPGGKVLRADGRVLARITGLGDDYLLPKTESLAHTIIGNGIPVQLTKGVIAPLLNKDDLSGRNVLARLGSSIFKNTWDADKQKQVSDRVVNTANKLGGAEATVYTSVDEVPDAYLSDVKNGATGWYDPTTHTVHVYLPNCADADEAQRTVFHEKIGHEGMEVLLGGEQGVRKFADFVYKSVDKKTRGKILDFANKYDPGWSNPDRINVGTQEYIAHLAEEGPTTAEDFSLWTKIKHYLIKVLKKLGIRVPGLLNDKDLRYYLMKAGKALHVWDNMPKEKQEAMMAQASNAEIKDALADGAGKGKPRQKKGESAIQYMKRVMEWKRWKEAREDKEDPEPPMFYDFDKDAEGKKEWERLIKENPMADMFAFEKQKQDEARQKYEDWLTRHELNEQNDADLDLYEGKIYPAETNPEADALELRVMQDLAEVTSTDVSKEGAATTVKHAVIHRRKNMEEASADDAIYINDVKNSIEKMAESGAFDKLLSDYQGKPNKAEMLAEAIPYIIEAPRRIREIAYKLNSTGVFGEGHIHITPDDVEAIQELRPQLAEVTAKKHTELKDGKEVELFDDMKGASEVASKMADIINGNHEKEPGFVPIDGTDILNKNVLPIILNRITPYGVDYKNLSEPMKSVLDSIRDWYNYTFDWLKDNNTLKADTGFTVDYVNHLWDKEKSDKQAYAMYVENRQRTKSPNEKPRQINTIMEGLEVGLVPKTTDITKMMAYYSRSNIEAWANKTMLQEVSGLNVIERNEDGEIISSDPLLSSVAPFNLEQYKYFEIPGVGPVWVYNVSPKQMKVKNPITGKDKVLYSEASAGDRFGVVFDTYQSTPFWKAFDTMASSMKKLELGFSGFHAGALTEVYMVQNMVEYGPKKALANFMKYIFADTMKNHQLPCFANPQDFQEAATHLVKFGATNDYAAADVQNMFDNMRDAMMKVQEKLKDGNGISGTVALATMPLKVATQMLSLINKGMDRALWDFLHDGLKLATYRMRADKTKERAKKKGWTEEELSRALDEDGQFVNDMFGGQHWDVLGASHRTLRYAGRVLLSPDWNASTTRHFLALTGYGSVWNEATLENFKGYYKRLYHKNLTPEDEGRRARQISSLLCYGLGFMVFYEAIANGINAAFRALDEEKERKKAEELRKTNPNYRSPYELAYPDGMKWYDYLMRGNSLGQQSKIFMGRYADGTEMYIRHGKQFREVPEYLFNHKGELEFPGPMVQRMIGKANPMVRMSLDDINYLSDFQASHADQEIQRKYGKTIGLLYKDALYWAPFLIPSQENKEFKAVDFFFPSSKGFSTWKAQSYFKDFILSGDMEGVVMTYQSCERNGIDPEEQIKAAIGSVKALESAEMKDGITSLQVASERFDEAKSITEKKKMRQKMKKFLSMSAYKAFTQKEALDMVQSYLNGEDDLKEMEKAENKYLMKAKSEDVTEDWRIQAVWNGTMETYDEYQRLKEVDKAKANAFKNSKTNKRLFAARKAISAAKKKMNKAKKQMDGQNDAAKMVEIRKTRKELIETLNGME
jgi:site-specific DNA-cytosine methylase